MKKIVVLAIIIVSIIITSCNLFINRENREIQVDVVLPSENARGTTPFTDENIVSVMVKIFYDTGNPTDGSLVSDSAELELTKLTDRWNASFSYDPGLITDTVVFLALAYNSSGEVVYHGISASNTINNFGTSTTITTTAEPFSEGDRGPGGGWVHHAKESYGTDDNIGKSWRYLEVAAEDLSLDWTDDITKVDTTNVVVSNGNVYEKNHADDPNYLVLSKYDWYWGPAGTYSTLPAMTDGDPNTDKLDGVSSATPSISIKTKGRPSTIADGNTRRDTVTNLKAAPINKLSDWFVPAKEDLASIYTNKGTIPISNYNLEATTYWTSSEDNDGIANASTDPVAVGVDISADEYWGWSIDFTPNTGSGATLAERFQSYRVRPIRAF